MTNSLSLGNIDLYHTAYRVAIAAATLHNGIYFTHIYIFFPLDTCTFHTPEPSRLFNQVDRWYPHAFRGKENN